MPQFSEDEITLVKGIIQRPDEPRHFMTIEQSTSPASVEIEGILVAQSNTALIVREVAKSIYDPVLYFPQDAILQGDLTQTDHTTYCPLKGKAIYFTLTVGDKTYENAIWSYEKVLDFEPKLKEIEGYLGFMPTFATIVAK